MSDLEEHIEEVGFLPMFQSCVRGFSVYENTADFWRDDEDGPWEWKGPIIREGNCAYGKFFCHKAGFVSMGWLPDFLNYRRTRHYAPNEDMAAVDEIVLQTIESEGATTVQELRQLLGFAKGRGKRRAGDLVDAQPTEGKISLEPILTRLMMETRVVISDFTYKIDKRGNSYGWGVARYTTPEQFYNRRFASEVSPDGSYKRMSAHLHRLLPMATDGQIAKLLG